MLALALILLSQVTPDSRVSRVERVPGGRMEGGRGGVKGWAFFEAFPVGGAGTTTACSTTAPTGAKGEALTFTRASSATCTKTATGGLATTGIANGDLVVLTNNQPRVEYDSAGTLGLLVESSRTNSLLRSQEIDNASWLPQNVGSALPVITANAATAPDGTLTADRVQIDACATGGFYSLVQSSTSAQTAATVSIYVRGVSGSGTLGVSLYSAGGPNGFASCSFVSTGWARCVVSATGASASTSMFIGCGNGVVNMTSTGAADVYVWGAQVENGAYATSYIPTTSAAVTRSAESASFDGLSISSANGLSWAATVWHPSENGGGVWGAGVNLVQDATNRTQLYRANTNVQNCDYFSTSGNRSVGTVITAYVAGQAYRQACAYSGAGASSTISNYRDGSIISTSAAGLTSAWTATSVLPGALGTAASTAPCDCITSRICIETNSTRCR